MSWRSAASERGTFARPVLISDKSLFSDFGCSKTCRNPRRECSASIKANAIGDLCDGEADRADAEHCIFARG